VNEDLQIGHEDTAVSFQNCVKWWRWVSIQTCIIKPFSVWTAEAFWAS